MAKPTISEFDIWMEVIAPDGGIMRPEDANAVLQWNFDEVANRRIKQLVDRNNEGKLTKAELKEFALYVHVGQVITVLQARARQSLKHSASDGDR